MKPIGIFPGIALPILFLALVACREKRIDFNTQIKPILNKNCITCHGGVKRNGGFSLLFRQDALDTVESGKLAIVPNHPELSEMIRRITLDDPEERMPYKEKPLSKADTELLKEWIAQGAIWGDHWAYVAPIEVQVPDPASDKSWPKTPIDQFILARLNENNLHPSPEAAKATLIRRVSLDLIGLPPKSDKVNAFIMDDSPDAYEKVVDELLKSPRFGEKWASWWLDMARYADTNGYEKDVSRSIWRYRDWVIKAFNDDMPFDEFTIEQLAGDLLPSPTDDQLVATGFHRNTMNNDEGGTLDEEFRTASVIDRVNTTMQVWQSTTFGCVQCHSHPYDPFRHDEYYKFMAFFNNTRDEDTPGEQPNLRIYSSADQEKLDSIRSWVRHHVGGAAELELTRFLKTTEPKHHAHDCDNYVNGALVDTKWMGIRSGGSCRLKGINMEGKTHLLMNYRCSANGGTMEIRSGEVNGDLIASIRVPNSNGKKLWIDVPLKRTGGNSDLYFIFRNPTLPKDQAVCLVEWLAFRNGLPDPENGATGSEINRRFLSLLNATTDQTPIMVENGIDQRRKTWVFERGNWLVHGKEVEPAMPASLNPMSEDTPRNRLGLAMWLTNDSNPLTARTVVNRYWEQLFGAGIVESLEDFGTEGELPSHPKLLDWLALRFMHDYQWSMKRMLKEMVMSATYRQDSRTTPELLFADPKNRLLARGPRVRLTAEQVRDQALAVSGLLSDKMYGPSVMPYQPDKVWQTVYNSEEWTLSEGEDRYRRAVYTFIKRTSPYPSAMMFDASSREVCVVRRIPTNTPLQALVTLNDPVYVEAAENLAKQMIGVGESAREQISEGYKMALLHEPPGHKLSILENLYNEAIDRYASKDQLGKERTSDPRLEAMIVVATALLNLDEFINNE
jgi:Protein of unknown function (DUF1553)/Protein of unknown function (DUF1549)/Planctomycete cytochrome C